MDKIYKRDYNYSNRIVFVREIKKTEEEIKLERPSYNVSVIPTTYSKSNFTEWKETSFYYIKNIEIKDVQDEPQLKEVSYSEYKLWRRATKFTDHYSKYFHKYINCTIDEREYEWREKKVSYLSTNVEIKPLENVNRTEIQG